MSWLIYTLIGVVSFSIYYTLARFFLKEKSSDPIAYAILFNFVSAGLIFLATFREGFILPNFQQYGINFILLALFYTASQVYTFKASKMIHASELIILSSTRAIWTIVAALVFLDETFNFKKVLGTLFILFAVWLVSETKKGIKFGKGQMYALLVALFLGLGFVNDSYILQTSDALSFSVMAFLLPALVTLVIFPKSAVKLQKDLNIDSLLKVILLALFYSTGMIFLYKAYQGGGNASQIIPIGQSIVVVTILFAAIFLNERENLVKKIVSAVIVGLGVILLS